MEIEGKIQELETEKKQLIKDAMSLTNRIKFNLQRWSCYGNCYKIVIDNRIKDREWSLKVYNKLLDELSDLSACGGNIDMQLESLQAFGIPIELGEGAVTLNFFYDNEEVSQLSDNWIPEFGENQVKYFLSAKHNNNGSGNKYEGYGDKALIIQTKINVLKELLGENDVEEKEGENGN